jgi:UDP-2,4-diacetamido-2,4,6-trideoxy-beta-L-altropyranose hydrolase
MYKIIFIAHGGSNIGMGHIIRCMSLANTFKLHNHNVIFISKYKTGQKVLLENKFNYIPINGKESFADGFHYGSKEELEEDWQTIKEILIAEKPDIIVIDSYNVTKEFFMELNKHTKCTIYIDDIAAFDYPVDIVINGNISAPLLEYKKTFKNQKFLLGLEYNLIRQEFRNTPKRNVPTQCNSIMISTGAADPHNMTEIILSTLINDSNLSEYTFHVIIGKGFKENAINQIRSMAIESNAIVLHQNPAKMSEIMLKSDLAITAGGSTLYELFACGVVTFAFIYADNQKDLVKESEKNGYLFNIGLYNEINQKDLIKKIIRVAENYRLRKSMVEKIQSVVDCNGTERIVEEVEKVMMEK